MFLELKMNVEELNARLVAKRELRDEFVKEVAQAIRNCGRSILATHHGDLETARERLSEAKKTWKKYKAMLQEHPWMYGTLINLEQELVEAEGYLTYVERHEFLERDPEIFPEAYVLGMADLIGELRRRAVELARQERLDEAMRVMEDAERLYMTLREIDYTAVKELRHKLDTYRRSLASLKEELTLIAYLEKVKR